ncbi:MAG TPA: diguanylate cyclase, partial [Planctomycetaceae bacterium]|nr:diguanylate cyclase [Planctomycetaceae bacterium]HQZ69034.1 diguanylate cyclase [Planctomycetaceae bacterium]
MKKFSSSIRIVLGLVSLSVSAILVAGMLGLIPNVGTSAQKNRAAFCEATAVSFMALAPRMNEEQIQSTFDNIRIRNPEVESIAARRFSDDRLVFASGPHAQIWTSIGDNLSTSREFIVPISTDQEEWGQLEIRFNEVAAGPLGALMRPEFSLAIFIGGGLFITFSLYLRRVLQHLNPSQVIPPRVREALDALAEGLLVLDRDALVMLANAAFAKQTAVAFEDLIGRKANSLGFRVTGNDGETDYPWLRTADNGQSFRGVLMKFGSAPDERTFSVSTVPIHDEKQRCRGVVASFEDVTELDRRQRELREALQSLKQSSDEIRQQNSELEWLATRDALTGCVNRRSFFKLFESNWDLAADAGQPLSAMMVDIDHFKSINDNYGHAKGDEILRLVAAAIMKTATEGDVVCRYGGEEFSVFMSNTSLDEAELRAERVRLAIKALKSGDVTVTASLGVSSMAQEASSPQDLLDQADKCLYVAKRHGRNQVVRFDKATEQIAQLANNIAPGRRTAPKPQSATSIPFQAVAALVSAMSFRHQPTAAHSRRVADLCVAAGEGVLSMRECYTLEIAALLHDIGKIGVPDAILHKSGQLTEREWEVMRRNRAVSLQLVKSSFASDALTEIVEQYPVWLDNRNAGEVSDRSGRPSLSARILAIADAYDSMTSDATYRRRKSRTEAFEELRRCAGTQFDPELVERTITAVRLRSGDRSELPGVSTDIALDIGLQIEQLAAALDDQDIGELRQLTQRLHATADRAGIQHMADVTDQLMDALEDETDIIGIMQSANELLDLCRLTQVSLIQGETNRLICV